MVSAALSSLTRLSTSSLLRFSMTRCFLFRHPEVRAQRASKDDGPSASAVVLRGPLRGHLRMTGMDAQSSPFSLRICGEGRHESFEISPDARRARRLPSVFAALSKAKKGKQNADRRCVRHLRTVLPVRRRALVSFASPLARRGCEGARLAYRRSTAALARGTPVPKAQVQARLPGTWFPRALPAVACPSPVAAPHAPVVMPASMMPGPARERSVWLRARAPHPLHLREYLRERRP